MNQNNSKNVLVFLAIVPLISLVIFMPLLFFWGCSNTVMENDGNIWPSVCISPNNEYILLSIYHGGNRNIYRVDKNNQTMEKLTSAPGSDIDPWYSPDGSKIVFSSSPSVAYGAAHHLYSMDADGSNRKQLTFGPSHDFAPVFSPDGKQIYFIRALWFGAYSSMASRHWHEMDLYSISVDGTNLRRITHGKYYDISHPSISPDGKRAMLRLGGRSTMIVILSVDSPNVMESVMPNMTKYLLNSETKHENIDLANDFYNPSFSPDGESMIFEWTPKEAGYYQYEIYLMDLTSKKMRKVTNLASQIVATAFSSDGKEIVFLSNPKRNDSLELWSINFDGTNLNRIDIPPVK